MELEAFLDHIRAEYVAQFEAAYEEQRSRFDDVHTEVALEISGDTFRHLYVADFLGKSDGKSQVIELIPTEQAFGGSGAFSYAGMSEDFHGASWDAVAFVLRPAPERLDGFEAWFDMWLNIDEAHPLEGKPYSGIIHSATWRQAGELEVDFGTAPVDAMTSLLRLFAGNGVQTIEVSSSRTISMPGQ